MGHSNLYLGPFTLHTRVRGGEGGTALPGTSVYLGTVPTVHWYLALLSELGTILSAFLFLRCNASPQGIFADQMEE